MHPNASTMAGILPMVSALVGSCTVGSVGVTIGKSGSIIVLFAQPVRPSVIIITQANTITYLSNLLNFQSIQIFTSQYCW